MQTFSLRPGARSLSTIALSFTLALASSCASNPVPGAPPPTAAARTACAKVRARDARCEASRRECEHVDLENACLAQSPTVRDAFYDALSRCFVDSLSCGSDGAQRIDECVNTALPTITASSAATAAAQALCTRCPSFRGGSDMADCVARITGPSTYGTPPSLALFTDSAAMTLQACVNAVNPPADAGPDAVCDGVNDCYGVAIGQGQTRSTCSSGM